MNYITLTVDGVDYKLRLDAKNTVALEKVLNTNPINELIKCANGEMPTLSFVSSTLHASLQKYQHGMTMEKVYEIIDKSTNEGKTLIDFIQPIMEVFEISGLIPKNTQAQDEQ